MGNIIIDKTKKIVLLKIFWRGSFLMARASKEKSTKKAKRSQKANAECGR